MFMETASKVRKKNLTYLNNDRLENMNSCINSIKRKRVPGEFLEFGIALGGSAICIASELDDDRRFIGFDVFGMIPPPGEKDGPGPNERYETIKTGRSVGIGGDRYYGYVNDLHQLVIKNFEDFGFMIDGHKIELVPGLYEAILPGLPEMTIAFAHIDCDWYEPVMLCLEYITPRLSPGGMIILDDYNDWPGCKKASDEFCARHPEIDVRRTSPHCVLCKRFEPATIIGRLSRAFFGGLTAFARDKLL
ncbi:MAG: asparagine synthase [Hyphomicrobiales bacterium]|nr:MAG: asparagine synthase [Hyphomicrobiales bacterium]